MPTKLKKILHSRRTICLLLMIAVIAGMLFNFRPFLSLEYRAYDLLSILRNRTAGIPVIIVAIDDYSIGKIGDWPWPRSYIAEVINTLSKSNSQTLGISILYQNRELNDGLVEVENLRDTLGQKPLLASKKILSRFDRLLVQTQQKIDHDAHLISAVRAARNVVLPLSFDISGPIAKPLPDPSGWLIMNSIEYGQNSAMKPSARKTPSFLSRIGAGQPIAASQVRQPYDELSRKSSALGHINLIADQDHIIRSVPLLIQFQDRAFLSFAVQIALKYFNMKIKDVRPGSSGLQIKHLRIPTFGQHRMMIDFSGHKSNIQTISAADVLEGKIPADMFRHKIVLLGLTAQSLTPLYIVPGQGQAAGIEIIANAVENLINRKQISKPAWSRALEIVVLLYFGFFLMFVIPKVQSRIGALIFVIFIATWIGTGVLLFITQGYWLHIVMPTLFAAVGFGLTARKGLSEKIMSESIELNKSFGLSLQGQGMLDMAFERFLKCPIEDKSVKALLYNLGLDFERKRMFNKALAVYHHILKAGAFKDIKQRINNLNKFEHSLVLGVGQKKKETTLFLEGSTTRPTLGRYEIIKELGHGAMGTVYLGRDPRINREVAIKTLSYADVDTGQLIEVKDQFFREAKAAGKLSHPKIVTIYDVGEDHDMAYIAMELLKGEDLTKFCQKQDLMSPQRVLNVGASVAEALDYAHRQDVVHRDIKPANIILLENDQIKVADFGIARVMNSSTKTQTGVIFGTPNYMSPEQVAGKKVDGRSDLFSLGVVLYEMLSAEKPFKGDSITTLMYAITNNSYTPLQEVAPDTPLCCTKLVDKLLRKGVSKRYQSAAQVLKQIDRCLDELKKQ